MHQESLTFFVFCTLPTSTTGNTETTHPPVKLHLLFVCSSRSATRWKAHAHNKDRTLAASMTPPPSPSTPKPSEANNPRERPHPLAKMQPRSGYSFYRSTRILPTTPHIHHNARPISAAKGRDRHLMVGRARDNRTPFTVVARISSEIFRPKISTGNIN